MNLGDILPVGDWRKLYDMAAPDKGVPMIIDTAVLIKCTEFMLNRCDVCRINIPHRKFSVRVETKDAPTWWVGRCCLGNYGTLGVLFVAASVENFVKKPADAWLRVFQSKWLEWAPKRLLQLAATWVEAVQPYEEFAFNKRRELFRAGKKFAESKRRELLKIPEVAPYL